MRRSRCINRTLALATSWVHATAVFQRKTSTEYNITRLSGSTQVKSTGTRSWASRRSKTYTTSNSRTSFTVDLTLQKVFSTRMISGHMAATPSPRQSKPCLNHKNKRLIRTHRQNLCAKPILTKMVCTQKCAFPATCMKAPTRMLVLKTKIWVTLSCWKWTRRMNRAIRPQIHFANCPNANAKRPTKSTHWTHQLLLMSIKTARSMVAGWSNPTVAQRHQSRGTKTPLSYQLRSQIKMRKSQRSSTSTHLRKIFKQNLKL